MNTKKKNTNTKKKKKPSFFCDLWLGLKKHHMLLSRWDGALHSPTLLHKVAVMNQVSVSPLVSPPFLGPG